MRWLWVLGVSVLAGCIAPGPAAPEGKVLLKANYPIVKIDNVAIESVYETVLSPGEHTVTVVYHTYRWDYHCRFRWQAEPDQRYEINNSENIHPLTLYRWVRANGLWAIRYDPLDPELCEKQPIETK